MPLPTDRRTRASVGVVSVGGRDGEGIQWRSLNKTAGRLRYVGTGTGERVNVCVTEGLLVEYSGIGFPILAYNI